MLLKHSPECISVLWSCFVWPIHGLVLSLERLCCRVIRIMPYYIAGQTCECLKEWHRTHVFCLVAHVTQQRENQRIQEKLSSKLCTVQSLKYCIERCALRKAVLPLCLQHVPLASGRLPQVGSKGKNQSGLESSLASMNTAKTALCSEWEQELHLCKRVKDMDEVLFLRRSFLSQSQYWKKQARMFDTNSGGNFFLCIFR